MTNQQALIALYVGARQAPLTAEHHENLRRYATQLEEWIKAQAAEKPTATAAAPKP